MRRNERKRQTLRIFAEQGALTAHEFGALAGIFPLRNTYTLLNRLHRWSLLSRRRSRATGRIVFNLTDAGRSRLEFLRKKLILR
jgi:hypothetical protein